MAEKIFDVAVVGLGAMGSAAAYHLSKNDCSVVGFDRYHPPHTFGSSHGETRIIRKSIGEGKQYIPVINRAYQLWEELEKEAGQRLLYKVGALIVQNPELGCQHHGPPDFLAQTVQIANENQIQHELLDAKQLSSRFPGLLIEEQLQGYYEPEGGYLIPEKCLKAQLELAQKSGAELKFNQAVTDFSKHPSGYSIKTPEGEYLAKRIILCSGPWIKDLAPEYFSSKLNVYRQILYWFEYPYTEINLSDLPVYIWLFGGDEWFYGFPALGGGASGVKIAAERLDSDCHPDTVNREVGAEEHLRILDTVKRAMPFLTGRVLSSAVCMYTFAPDTNFLIDWHPELEDVLLASPCSGHGFKHSAAIGEALAELSLNGQSKIDLSPFSIQRFN